MKILVYPETGDQAPKEATIRDEGRDQLFDLQAIIGGYVEPIHTQRLSMQSNVALVDEDGRVKDRRPNTRATLDIAYGAILFGTVVVLGEIPSAEGGKTWTDIHIPGQQQNTD